MFVLWHNGKISVTIIRIKVKFIVPTGKKDTALNIEYY